MKIFTVGKILLEEERTNHSLKKMFAKHISDNTGENILRTLKAQPEKKQPNKKWARNLNIHQR